MRWSEPVLYVNRTVSRFLWLPKTIGRETRWFEFAEWRELYKECKSRSGWVPQHWVDE